MQDLASINEIDTAENDSCRWPAALRVIVKHIIELVSGKALAAGFLWEEYLRTRG